MGDPLGLTQFDDLALGRLQQLTIVNPNRGMGSDRDDQLLGFGGEHARLVVTEEETSINFAGARHHRDRQIADDWQMSRWHAVVRSRLAIARVSPDVVGAHDTDPAKRRLKNGGVTRQLEVLECGMINRHLRLAQRHVEEAANSEAIRPLIPR
ncbi:hypothetical protein ASD01_17445 [Ensifer sp. Root423]|nr:hypothetical protein ASD01_17445 [Ensifer sp. Root423]